MWNRRLVIAYYWLFKEKHNVSFEEFLRLMVKPRVEKHARQYIKSVLQHEGFLAISFDAIEDTLFWPQEYDHASLCQVSTEIFDNKDWHYYEVPDTRVDNNDVVVDIGAAEGLFALSVVSRCRKVIVLEPDTIFFKALQKTFASYQDSGRARLVNMAISDSEGSGSIVLNGLSSCIDDSQKGSTRIAPLDIILQDELKIDYIKADIEGFEMNMLRGARETIKKHRPKMAITCYHGGNDYKEMIQFVLSICPDYRYYVKGITQYDGRPVMVHFSPPENN